MRRFRGPRDEQGAIAVAFAIMSVLLFMFAALAVDLGNAWTRKTDTQNQADFGAFNVAVGHAQEIYAGVAGTHPTVTVSQAIADFFNENAPQDDQAGPAVQASDLMDGDMSNGDATYTPLGLRVTTPDAWVKFGFANVADVPGQQVQSQATVSVFTAGPRMFPVFAIDAPCSTGRHNEGFQEVKETTNGQTNPPASPPPLLITSPYNSTVLTNVEMIDSGGTSVDALAVGSSGNTIKVTGTNWGPTVEVALFQSPDKKEPASFITVTTPIQPAATPNTSQTFDVAIPDTVATAAGVWYVSVRNEGTGPNVGWSAPNNASTVIVDPATIIPGCSADGSDEGNFGVVDYPRSGSVNDGNEVALNLVSGTQDPFGVTVHTGASAAYDWKCNEPTAGANESDPNPEPKTNCLTTVTGLTMDPFQEGLVDGYAGKDGLLEKDNSPVCGGSRKSVTTQGGTALLNNEPLSCYLDLPAGKTLNDISKVNYSGEPAFKPEIYKSPRFGYVPIFRGSPSSLTGLETRSIVGFQAAFIADADGGGADGVHGLGFETKPNGKQDLKSVTMFLFGIGALPDPPDDAALINYLGVGDPIVHLVN